ncbi:MAG: hypothetical protein ACETV0_07800 [Nitrososphaeria archaeon]
MPRKIVIRDETVSREEEAPSVESEGKEEPAQEEGKESVQVVEKAEEGVSKPEATPERDLEEAKSSYEALLSRMNDIKLRDTVFQRMFRDQDISVGVAKKIISRWDESREAIVQDSAAVKNKFQAAKGKLESSFATTEEELYLSTIELNTLQMKEKESGGKTIEVGAREELEAQIPVLRQRLFELRERIKEVDSRIRELDELPQRIDQRTVSTQIPNELYEEMKSRYGSVYGEKVDTILQTNIANAVQNEGIRREYATILVWKKLKVG